MGCRSILAVAVVAASLLGADASPCKPATSTAVSVIQSEALSTVASDATSAVLVETSLTLSNEATSDALTDATTTADATTSTVLIEKTPTTLAGSTTTTEAEVCTKTQVIINPGFDDNTDGAPWYHTGHVTQDGAHSSPNSLSITVLKNAGGYGLFQQNLHNLNGNYKLSYRWTITEVVPASGNVYCTLQPRIAYHHFDSIVIEPWGIGEDLKLSTDRWSTEGADLSETLFSIRVDCMGGFSEMSFRFDDVTLTKVCDDDLEPMVTPTTLLESTPTTLAETASTTSVEITTEATTSAVITEESTTTLAASTTTTEAEACAETQVISNPGFDDNTDGSPWMHNGQVTEGYTPSDPNNLEVTLYPNAQTSTVSQKLHNIKAGEYKFSYRWRLFTVNNDIGDYACYVFPTIGTTGLPFVYPDGQMDVFAHEAVTWSTSEDVNEVTLTLEVGCGGDYSSIVFNYDDVTLTRVCPGDAKP